MPVDPTELAKRLQAGCQAVVAAEAVLSEADRAIGDGDHGVAMSRGFSAASEALGDAGDAGPAELFRTIGMALLSKAGGASGAIFGTFFLGTAKALSDACEPADLVEAMREGLNAVMARGGAKAGDKTVIDALVPALDEAASATASLDDLLATAARGAEAGVEATRDMLAATGKARSLGARAQGFVDPGALSMSIFLKAAADQS